MKEIDCKIQTGKEIDRKRSRLEIRRHEVGVLNFGRQKEDIL